MPQFWVIGRIEEDNSGSVGGRESAGVRRESIGPFADYEDAKKAWAERAREAARQSRFDKSRFPGGRPTGHPEGHSAGGSHGRPSGRQAAGAQASGAGQPGPRARYRIERIDPDEPPLCTD